jgi:hypothetical protein
LLGTTTFVALPQCLDEGVRARRHQREGDDGVEVEETLAGEHGHLGAHGEAVADG